MSRLAVLVALGHGHQSDLVSACGSGGYYPEYAGERCWDAGNQFGIKCETHNSGSGCGARVKKNDAFGVGDVAMKIQAAPGPGVVTSFYISNNGGMYSEGSSWNEVDFEIMGGTVRDGGASTAIWTNFFTGSGVEHHGFVSVPFDATAGEHIYAIRLNYTHVQWLVDWKPIRTDDFTAWPDMVNAVKTNSFQSYASVWGKGYSDPEVGCREFVDSMGKLDENPNAFPIQATFVPEQGGAPFSIARFEDKKSVAPRLTMTAIAMSAGFAAFAAACALVAAAYRRRQRAALLDSTGPEVLAKAMLDEQEEEFDSI